MEYFLGSIKIMLIVGVLSGIVSMLVAWVIKLIFAVIHRQGASAAAQPAAAGTPTGAARGESGKVA